MNVADKSKRRPTSITVKEFKLILPYLYECFRMHRALLVQVGFALCKKSSGNNEIIPFQMDAMDSFDDEDLLLFFILDEDHYQIPPPILSLPPEEITFENVNLFIRILWIVEHIYAETQELNEEAKLNRNNTEATQEIIDGINYTEYIRPDMLRLYNFVNDWKKIPQSEKIILKCGAKSIELNNHENWVFTAINRYLDEHLRVASVEQAKEELKSDYSTKTGRKINNRYQSAIIYGLSCTYQKMTNDRSVSNQLCRFIREYLKFLGMPITEDDFDHDDQLSIIKAKIYEYRKKGGSPNWLANGDPEDLKRISFNFGW